MNCGSLYNWALIYFLRCSSSKSSHPEKTLTLGKTIYWGQDPEVTNIRQFQAYSECGHLRQMFH